MKALKDKEMSLELISKCKDKEELEVFVNEYFKYEDVKEAVLELELLFAAHDKHESIKMLKEIFGDFSEE